MLIKTEQIVLYDGDCAFCNRTVAFVFKNEKNSEVYFSPIQSDFSSNYFETNNLPRPDLNTFYFIEYGVVYEKSSAAIRLSRYLKFPYSLMQISWIIPRFIRDGVYNKIARKRHLIAKGYCFIPTQEQRDRLL